MKIFRNIFRRKEKPDPQPLRIEGIAPAPMTPEPDEAELAAFALLEAMAEVSSFKKFQVSSKSQSPETRNLNAEGVASDKRERSGKPETGEALKPETRDANYYKELASRIRKANDAAVRRTMRFVSFCEQELEKPGLPVTGEGSLAMLEAELYKRIDTVERVGGELKIRWQHCLAEVTVRLMNPGSTAEDEEENKV